MLKFSGYSRLIRGRRSSRLGISDKAPFPAFDWGARRRSDPRNVSRSLHATLERGRSAVAREGASPPREMALGATDTFRLYCAADGRPPVREDARATQRAGRATCDDSLPTLGQAWLRE